MTVDEIKQSHSMCDIVESYGFHPNRAGFVPCPFHTGDHTASMKIYKDSYNCLDVEQMGTFFHSFKAWNIVILRQLFTALVELMKNQQKHLK